MLTSSWLRLLNRGFNSLGAPRTRRTPLKRRPSCHPSVEALEDRSLPSTFAVLNTTDEGSGSLRQAILDANANPGADLINFAIAGAGVHTIAVGSTTGKALPDITDAVTIDGYSQTGASANTLAVGDNAVLRIQVDGGSLGLGYNGLHATADSSTIEGLMIGNFRYSAPPDYMGGYGILLETGSGDIIRGNYIGNNGVTAFANTFGVGLGTGAVNSLIGGTTPAARNVISGNSDGVFGAGSGNRVQGNYIGLNAAGDAALPNTEDGVNFTGVMSLIGGTEPGAGNVISGNGRYGLAISGVNVGPGYGNVVQGNLIGTDAAGTTAVGNIIGVHIGQSDHHLIGGTTAAARNVISGNLAYGIEIIGNFAHDNVVQGNYVGTNATAEAPLANGNGIFLLFTANNQIGGTTAGAGNVVAGNQHYGILLSSFAAPDGPGNVVQGTFIGTNAAGSTSMGNGTGVFIEQGSHDNQIGGTAPGAGNTIAFSTGAFNGGAGVAVADAASTGNAIRGNSIYDNAGLGIDLGADGVTPNDRRDSDVGANNLQNFPVLVLALSLPGGQTLLVGSLNSAPSSTFTLDFYTSAAADPSGFGEGERYLGSRTVVTNSSGNALFAFVLATPTISGQVVSATATDPAGNTSEFSHVLQVYGLPRANGKEQPQDKPKQESSATGHKAEGDPAPSSKLATATDTLAALMTIPAHETSFTPGTFGRAPPDESARKPELSPATVRTSEHADPTPVPRADSRTNDRPAPADSVDDVFAAGCWLSDNLALPWIS